MKAVLTKSRNMPGLIDAGVLIILYSSFSPQGGYCILLSRVVWLYYQSGMFKKGVLVMMNNGLLLLLAMDHDIQMR